MLEIYQIQISRLAFLFLELQMNTKTLRATIQF